MLYPDGSQRTQQQPQQRHERRESVDASTNTVTTTGVLQRLRKNTWYFPIMCVCMGAVLVAAVYNKTVVHTDDRAETSKLSGTVRSAIVGAILGLCVYVYFFSSTFNSKARNNVNNGHSNADSSGDDTSSGVSSDDSTF